MFSREFLTGPRISQHNILNIQQSKITHTKNWENIFLSEDKISVNDTISEWQWDYQTDILISYYN